MSEDIDVSVESEDSQKPTSEPPSSSGRPKSKAKIFIDRMNAMKGVILAISALVASIASFFKPTDTTATKNSYEYLSKQVEQLSKTDVQNHDDVMALRSYLEGYIKAQSQNPNRLELGFGQSPPPLPGSGFGAGMGRLGGSSPSPSSSKSSKPPTSIPEVKLFPGPSFKPNEPESNDSDGSGSMGEPTPPLPPVGPRPKAFKPESFDSMLK
jgi:hypothetical protein